MAKIRIRIAKPKELMNIADLVLDTFLFEINTNIRELEGTEIANKDKFYDSYVQRAIDKTPFIIYVAELNDKIIGVAGGSIFKHHWGNELWGAEDFWFVKKEHRGSKAGIKLFEKLMKWFEDNQAKRIQMTHYTWNPKIKDFYEKRGFKPYEVCYVYKVGE